LVLKLSNGFLLQLEIKVKLKSINWLTQNIIWSANLTKHWGPYLNKETSSTWHVSLPPFGPWCNSHHAGWWAWPALTSLLFLLYLILIKRITTVLTAAIYPRNCHGGCCVDSLKTATLLCDDTHYDSFQNCHKHKLLQLKPPYFTKLTVAIYLFFVVIT